MRALKPAAAAGLGVVHLIDDDDAGNAGLVGVAPDALGDRLDAVLGVDHDEGRFDGQQGRAGLVGEHMKAGSIDEIDFDALPLGKGDGVLHGCAAGYFFFVIGGYGRAIFHAALGGGHLGGMQQSGDQGGFATVRMPHYSYVADLTSLVRFHGVLLHLLGTPAVGQAAFGWSAPEKRRGSWVDGNNGCNCWIGMREGQRNREDARGGVRVAGLEGHVSRSAVYLVRHWEGLGPAPRGGG